MDKVEASMNASERQYAELREKNAALSKAKVRLLYNTLATNAYHVKSNKRLSNCKINLWFVLCRLFINSLAVLQLLNEEVLSHSSLLETIELKGSGMAEHYVTQLELQDLQERYKLLKDRMRVQFFFIESHYVLLSKRKQRNSFLVCFVLIIIIFLLELNEE